jgi:hypothetical protein
LIREKRHRSEAAGSYARAQRKVNVEIAAHGNIANVAVSKREITIRAAQDVPGKQVIGAAANGDQVGLSVAVVIARERKIAAQPPLLIVKPLQRLLYVPGLVSGTKHRQVVFAITVVIARDDAVCADAEEF